MDNSSYRNQYINRILGKGNLSEESVQSTRNFWNRLSNAEDAIGKHLEDGLTKEELVLLFSKLNMLNARTFRVRKSQMKKYLEWLSSTDIVDSGTYDVLKNIQYSDLDCSEALVSKYFRDLPSLQSKIDETLDAADRADHNVFATQISLIYLMWYGVSLEDALNIRKEDVLEDCIRVGDRMIRPNAKVMDYIKQYRDADGYQSYGRGIIFLKYIQSEYLFRSVRASRIDPKKAVIAVVRFGKSGEEKNPYNCDRIYWSGIFYRAYLSELEDGPIAQDDSERIQVLFQEKYQDRTKARLRLQEYQKYRDFFYPTRSYNS